MEPATNEPQPSEKLRVLRHDLRGRMNTLVMCAAVLDPALTRQEALEYLGYIEDSADRLLTVLDRMDAMS
jgi:signal transduction histidine kinase